MRNLISIAVGTCLALSLLPAAFGAEVSDDWASVPDQTLRDLRGGFDLPQTGLVADFAIDRVIEINGQVVAQMQIVISNLGLLGSGASPTISISGATAALVQVLNSSGLNLSPAAFAPVTALAPSQPAQATAPAAVASTAPASAPQFAVSAMSGLSPAAAMQPGASSVANAAGTAAGSAAGAVSASIFPQGAPPVTPSAPSSGTASTIVPTVVANANAGASAAGSGSVTAAVGTSGTSGTGGTGVTNTGANAPLIVISSLPNATAISTAVQNQVQAATIQIQTTIAATLNSLSLASQLSLANSIRSQVGSSIVSSFH